ncbi:uncharacterized protein SCHCODRAFT_02129141 [Schizophyllum commune H4-8]|nr:uncharacterized protein SCHCODRAFT_02129141 [Schizophyllum commune H4-8]KAI5885018.1 hypothetical protein SCHCODRAFT_02129141 [Schizophyllum commune H4-8]
MATAAPPAVAISDVRTSLGPILIASVLAWVLWGMLTMQVIRYYLSYKRDHTFVKWIVGIVWFLDLSHAIILFRGIYQCLVNDFGQVVSLDRARVMGEMPPRMLVTIIVQGFCFWRIWKLYRSYIPIVLYVVTSLLQIIFTIIYLMGSFGAVPAARRLFFLNLSGFGYLAAVLVADVTMAGMLTTLLYKQHQETPYQKTSEMLRRLFYFSINTGTWTAVFAVAAIILSKHPLGTYYWAIFDLGVCGIYSNTLLVNLNGRDYVVGEQAVALSFYKSTGDSSRTARGSGSRGHRRSGSAAVEDVSVFEAAKRSQISDV